MYNITGVGKIYSGNLGQNADFHGNRKLHLTYNDENDLHIFGWFLSDHFCCCR